MKQFYSDYDHFWGTHALYRWVLMRFYVWSIALLGMGSVDLKVEVIDMEALVLIR